MVLTHTRPASPEALLVRDRRAQRTRRYLVVYVVAALIWLLCAVTGGWWVAWAFTALFGALAIGVVAKLVRDQRATTEPPR